MARGWMNSPMFANEALCERAAWVWLIENAAFAPRQIRVGSTMVDVERGQLVASLRFLADAWRWNKNRVDRFLKTLEQASAINRAQIGTATGVVTLCNYDQYQTSRDTNGTDLGQIRDKNGTKDKERELRAKKENISLEADFEVWMGAYPRKVARPAAFKAYLKARTKADAATLLAGIENYRKRKPDYADWAYPATWLNGERWLDQPDSLPANPTANGSAPRDPDLEIKAQARTIAKGLACPSATPGRVATMVAKGYLTAEQAQKAGYA